MYMHTVHCILYAYTGLIDILITDTCIILLGCGKTLVARALANECSKEGRKVAFFMRKGADCLSKWVGESERQLRLLFDQVRGFIIIVYHKI